MSTRFDQFSVGDVAVFERRFTNDDFASFSALSGDTNPLHRDADYAKETEFDRPIVPMHLTIAPMSRIAGMILPGEPSLYLSHEIQASRPVYYDDVIRYSARIAAISPAQRVLVIAVLALRGSEVVLEANMRVRALKADWETPCQIPLIHTAAPGRALITGASGAIGSAIARELASHGWSLLLQDRGDAERRRILVDSLKPHAGEIAAVTADLATSEGRRSLGRAIADLGDIEALVHAASPALDASLSDLIEVNYLALRTLTEAALPGMLDRQKGRILFIASTAVLHAIRGWEDYTAAKTAATGLVSGFERHYAKYGIRAMTLMPGFVETPFSKGHRKAEATLLPQEVAIEAAEMVNAPGDAVTVLEVGKKHPGVFGFQAIGSRQDDTPRRLNVDERNRSALRSETGDDSSEDIAAIIREVLKLPANMELRGTGLGITTGWDSLRQIEIILAVEKHIGAAFSSGELNTLMTYEDIIEACNNVGDRKSRVRKSASSSDD